MTKIALLCDTHFGVRQDSPVFLDHQEEFFKNIFFPYLIENEIKTLFHLGDTFDRRKQVNFLTLQRSKQFFFDKIASLDIDYHTITGNHDLYFTNTGEINSVKLLLKEYPKFKVYDNEPVELSYGAAKIMLSPWITKTNEEVSIRAFSETRSTALMGHFEIMGFEMMKGILSTHGYDKKVFSKFESVYSGHFHHPSEYGNVKYLGAQYEMNWSDYNGRRGFHVYDTETKSLNFIENPVPIHHKIIYEDTEMTIEEVSNLDLSMLKNKFVKVIIKNRTKPYIFDLLMDKIGEAGTADLKSVEDSLSLDFLGGEEIIEGGKDTRTVLHDYIDTIETNISKERIKTEIDSLYMEALNLI